MNLEIYIGIPASVIVGEMSFPADASTSLFHFRNPNDSNYSEKNIIRFTCIDIYYFWFYRKNRTQYSNLLNRRTDIKPVPFQIRDEFLIFFQNIGSSKFRFCDGPLSIDAIHITKNSLKKDESIQKVAEIEEKDESNLARPLDLVDEPKRTNMFQNRL